VVYLEPELIGSHRAGRAVGHPSLRDPALRTAVHRLHGSLRHPGDAFEAEGRLGVVTERLVAHLDRRQEPTARSDPGLARRLRELLDCHLVEGISLADAAAMLQTSPTHLVRTFRHATGMPPHRYLTGRRLDRARRLLLEGQGAAEVASVTGFYDQAHLTRHFRRLLGVTPGAYAASAHGTT
jgi:AraC-like DNA-binding protein